MKRLYKSVLLGCGLFWLAADGPCAEVEIPVASNLQADGQQARAARLPILLSFSALVCEYCRQLEDQFLRPMLISGEYSDRVLIRRVLLDNGYRTIDFSGERISTTQLSDRYKVYVTPTLLFLDGNGNELARRMVGINTPEMYGGYLDNCIDTALYVLRKQETPAHLHGCGLHRQTGTLSPAAP
jgi:thioredoxin-related protein